MAKIKPTLLFVALSVFALITLFSLSKTPNTEIQDLNSSPCVAGETLVNTKQGLVRIDQLTPKNHAIYYHKMDGQVGWTHNYSVKKTGFSKVWKVIEAPGGNLIKVTANHLVAVTKFDGQALYHYRPAGTLNRLNSLMFLNDTSSDFIPKQPQNLYWSRLKEEVACWDITNYEKCWYDEGNFILNGMLVHNQSPIEKTSVGGKISPSGKEINVDLPEYLHISNVGGSDGAGLCVFTSIDMAARWGNVEQLIGFQKWMRAFPGGSWPEKTDQKIKQICKERGMEIPSYIQVEGKREILPILKTAIDSGRMVSITYNFSPTGRYGGRRIAHMTSLVSYDDEFACVLDNNYIGDNKLEWMDNETFYRVFTDGGNGWAVILLASAPPSLPFN